MADDPNVTAKSGVNKGLANLRPWKPGQSGNPSGRPKKKPITEAYEKLLENDPEACLKLARAMLATASKEGKAQVHAAAEITDRLEGKPTQSIDMTASIYQEQDAAKLEERLQELLAKRDAKQPDVSNG